MRDWWLRTLLVLQRPRPVFVALRDSSAESLSDRGEPILAIVFLAGIAGALATSSAGSLLDDSDYNGLLVAVWAFIAGGFYGLFAYWLLGALLYLPSRLLGSQGTYRRSRHVVGFAAVPIALSLVVWPVKLAVYGEDVFRSGGRDAASGAHAFSVVELAFCVWAAALLVVGVRSVHGWTWSRAFAASVLALGAGVALVATSV